MVDFSKKSASKNTGELIFTPTDKLTRAVISTRGGGTFNLLFLEPPILVQEFDKNHKPKLSPDGEPCFSTHCMALNLGSLKTGSFMLHTVTEKILKKQHPEGFCGRAFQVVLPVEKEPNKSYKLPEIYVLNLADIDDVLKSLDTSIAKELGKLFPPTTIDKLWALNVPEDRDNDSN